MNKKQEIQETIEKQISNEKVVLLDFGAEWCNPCKQLKKTLEEVEKEFENVKFHKLDVEVFEALAEKNKVRGIPTIVIYKKNKEAWRRTGIQSKDTLVKALKYVINEFEE